MGMVAPVTASERDLRALLGIVSDNRDDLPAEGLPPSLLADLTGLIRCDGIAVHDFDGPRQKTWFAQSVPALDDAERARFGKYDLGALAAFLGLSAVLFSRPDRGRA